MNNHMEIIDKWEYCKNRGAKIEWDSQENMYYLIHEGYRAVDVTKLYAFVLGWESGRMR